VIPTSIRIECSRAREGTTNILMKSKSWVGGADFTDASGYKSSTTWPLVRLSLDDQGGRLHLSATSGILGSVLRWAYDDEPSVRFACSEVREVQRKRPTLVPEESVYFRLQRSNGELEEFVFTASRNGNDEVIDFAESSGLRSGTGRPLFGFR